MVVFIAPLLCQNSIFGETLLLDQFGGYGASTGVPFVATGSNTTRIVLSQAPGFPSCTARINRIGATISCIGAGGSLNPNTFVRYGTIRGKVDPQLFATWGAMATFLGGQSGLHMRTGAALQSTKAHIVSFPLDYYDWASFKETGTNASGTTVPIFTADTMAPIVMLFSGTTASDSYQIALHVEWNLLVEGSGNSGGLLNSANAVHPTLPEEVIHDLSNAANDVAGHVEAASEAGLATIGSAYTAARASRAFGAGAAAAEYVAPRALPALAL